MEHEIVSIVISKVGGDREAVITFEDGGVYAIRPDGIGDSIFGVSAHKYMYSIDESMDFNDKVVYICNNSKGAIARMFTKYAHIM